MTNVILMLLTLTTPLLLARATANRRDGTHDAASAAAMGAGLLFLFTASGHFLQTDAMAQMLPPWVPARAALVYATGVMEIGVALAFFSARLRRNAGWAAIAMLVAFFPANVYAAFEQVGLGGHLWGPTYLLIRGPLQLFIIGWIGMWVVRPSSPTAALSPQGQQ
jgi:uncharacterized membrane protein